MDHKLDINENQTATASTGGSGNAPARKTYVVTSKTGLFKNGKQYNQGETIELDAKTAQNFMDQNAVATTEDPIAVLPAAPGTVISPEQETQDA